MSEKHTPGQITTRTAFDGAQLHAPKAANVQVAWVAANGTYGATSYAISPDEARANAERLAAAWNACEGIPTSHLTPGLLGEMRRVLGHADAMLSYLWHRHVGHADVAPHARERVEAAIGEARALLAKLAKLPTAEEGE